MSDSKHIMMAHGHTGRIMKLDLELNLLAATGAQGKGPNQYGEAHYLALDAQDNIYVADSLNWNVAEAGQGINFHKYLFRGLGSKHVFNTC